MSEEIFDVVDANDQVIGQQPRSEVLTFLAAREPQLTTV